MEIYALWERMEVEGGSSSLDWLPYQCVKYTEFNTLGFISKRTNRTYIVTLPQIPIQCMYVYLYKVTIWLNDWLTHHRPDQNHWTNTNYENFEILKIFRQYGSIRGASPLVSSNLDKFIYFWIDLNSFFEVVQGGCNFAFKPVKYITTEPWP